jgi:hypothetical protein
MGSRQWLETVGRLRDDWRMRAAIARRLEIYVGTQPTPRGRLRRLFAP